MTTRLPMVSPAGSRTRRAFSLIEVLVVVSMLSIIIYGLMLMFNQTQRALRAGIAQVDVLQSGRATMEMMAREMEQAAASRDPAVTNLYIRFTPFANSLVIPIPAGGAKTNSFQEICFLTAVGDDWVGIGYRLAPTNSDAVATLYRYRFSESSAYAAYTNAMTHMQYGPARFPGHTNYHRVAEGVVHLNLSGFDRDGNLITNAPPLNLATGELTFADTALPSYIELELAVLEPQTLEQFYAQIDPVNWSNATQLQRGRDYLARQAGRIHLFRQRIPVRTAIR